jgi:hypothetical protein
MDQAQKVGLKISEPKKKSLGQEIQGRFMTCDNTFEVINEFISFGTPINDVNLQRGASFFCINICR